MPEGARSPVEATITGFAVIAALCELEGAGVSALSAHVDVPKRPVRDHLQTMEEAQFHVEILGNRGLPASGYETTFSDADVPIPFSIITSAQSSKPGALVRAVGGSNQSHTSQSIASLFCRPTEGQVPLESLAHS